MEEKKQNDNVESLLSANTTTTGRKKSAQNCYYNSEGNIIKKNKKTFHFVVFSVWYIWWCLQIQYFLIEFKLKFSPTKMYHRKIDGYKMK